MKILLILLAKIFNSLPKTDFILVHWCRLYEKHGLESPNLVGMNNAPTVSSTSPATSITFNSATASGNITATGGENPSTRGVCYVEGTGTPDLSDTVSSESGSFGTGAFSRNLTGLSPGTTYTFRAFATNSVGTGFGSNVQFTTSSQTPPTVVLNSPADEVNTYYFDGSDAPASDPDNVWNNETNADDGDTGTVATNPEVDTGDKTLNYIQIEGTNAPASGGVISQVRARLHDGNNFGNYAILDEPIGGWTWEKIQALETRSFIGGPATSTTAEIYIDGDAGGTNLAFFSGPFEAINLSKIEIEVTSAPTLTDTTPTLDFTGTDAQGDDIRYNVQVDTVNTFDSTSGEKVVDSYSESNQNFTYTAGFGISGNYIGQSFTGDGTTLSSITAYCYISSGSNGTVEAEIYAHSGTYGTNSVPTGNPLATSDARAVTSLSGSLALENFVFSGANQITLNNGTKYVLVLHIITTDAVIRWGVDTTSPTHSGNSSFLDGSWVSDSADLCFYVYSSSNVPLLDKTSNTDPGFDDPDSADTDPFTSGNNIQYTVQAGDELADGTYYWRVRGLDPSGSNTYGAWSDTRSFVISAGGSTTGHTKIFNGSTWDLLPTKHFNGSIWTQKPMKRFNGSGWDESVE